ncbi:MAG TPA: hypothetical protein VGR48_08130 [Terriglobales bacterium]|nr:hypothetical protein [Terriglobales bacterium]
MEVKVTPPLGVSRWAAELCRTDGAILRLAHDVPPGLLQQLLRAC